jgi:hypothetical protein
MRPRSFWPRCNCRETETDGAGLSYPQRSRAGQLSPPKRLRSDRGRAGQDQVRRSDARWRRADRAENDRRGTPDHVPTKLRRGAPPDHGAAAARRNHVAERARTRSFRWSMSSATAQRSARDASRSSASASTRCTTPPACRGAINGVSRSGPRQEKPWKSCATLEKLRATRPRSPSSPWGHACRGRSTSVCRV